MTTRERALRCAASLPKHLLSHNWRNEHNVQRMMRYSISPRQLQRRSIGFLDQMERCQSDEARRILLGVSR